MKRGLMNLRKHNEPTSTLFRLQYTCGFIKTVEEQKKKGIFFFPLLLTQKQLVPGNKESHVPSYSKAWETGARWGREGPWESLPLGSNLTETRSSIDNGQHKQTHPWISRPSF